MDQTPNPLDQTPKPPAQAYFAMQDHLHPGYFTTAPPARGALVEVIGHDGISTQWAMDVVTAQRLMEPLRLDDRVVRVIPGRY